MRLCLVAAKPTDAVLEGFLPAAARLGLDVRVLTDRPAAYPDVATTRCDVWDHRALIGALAAGPAPDAVFSNSDHLQAQTALAAAYFGLPGKDWRSSLRAKNKPLMRHRLAASPGAVAWAELTADSPLPDLPYPVVLKPAEGVASEDVVLVAGPEILARRGPGERLIAEEFLGGPLRTLETVGDGHTTWVLGGFLTEVSPPPLFIEEQLTWDPRPSVAPVLRALGDLGVGFGACHTEFIGDRIVEVNDRLIGDRCEFLLDSLLAADLFELVLRVHLGERLPASSPPPPRLAAVASYISAQRPGLLRSAPRPGPVAPADPGVDLRYWPFARVGERIGGAGSNRDYLGVFTAAGPDPAAVSRSVAAARAGGSWEVA